MFVTSTEQLDEWIRDNYFLHDVSVPVLRPMPRRSAANVSITLRFQVAGGYSSGEVRTVRTIEILAHNITQYDLHGAYHPDNSAEGASTFDPDEGIGLEIDVPGILRIAADRFEVRTSVDVVDLVPEWLSDRSYTVVLRKSVPPTPRAWLGEFKRSGYSVAWRYYAGDERSPDVVPPCEYGGWFVQKQDRLKLHAGGLLFDSCSCHKEGYVLTLANNDLECNDLWQIAGNYLSSISDATIHCGNATMAPEAFRNHLAKVTSACDSCTEQADELEPQ